MLNGKTKAPQNRGGLFHGGQINLASRFGSQLRTDRLTDFDLPVPRKLSRVPTFKPPCTCPPIALGGPANIGNMFDHPGRLLQRGMRHGLLIRWQRGSKQLRRFGRVRAWLTGAFSFAILYLQY